MRVLEGLSAVRPWAPCSDSLLLRGQRDEAWLEECRSRWHIDLVAAEDEEELSSSSSQRLRTLLGAPHDESLLASAALIVLSPGVPPGLPCFSKAKAKVSWALGCVILLRLCLELDPMAHTGALYCTEYEQAGYALCLLQCTGYISWVYKSGI